MKRILVIGRQRSGTKWLTNLIANSPALSCVQSDTHGGVIETNLFDKMERAFGDFRVDENRQAFNACFKETGFFRLTRLPSSVVDNSVAGNYIEFFTEVMDAFAKQNGNSGWILKASSLLAENIHKHIPDVEFVLVQRDPIDNLISTIHLESRNKKWASIAKTMFGYVYAFKTENSFRRKNKALLVKFESLKTEKEQAIKEVFNYLELPFDSDLLEDKFKKNTSFKSTKRPEFSLTMKSTLKMLWAFANLIPLPILHLIRRFLGEHKASKRRFLPRSFDV